jgi:predicted nucleic acid-binding protein
VLYAAVDRSDEQHEACVHELGREDLLFVIPALVVAEASYLVETRLGPAVEATFLRGLAEYDVEGPAPDDFTRMAELVDRYASFPLGGTDASLIALAERSGARLILTLDRRHFGAVKPSHVEAFELLP